MADPRPGTVLEQVRNSGVKLQMPLLDRLRRSYVVDQSGCWIWQLERDAWGYGNMHVGSTRSANHLVFQAHRVSYELQVGPIPPGLVLDHLCRTPACVNPSHLEPVTVRENLLRGEGIGAKNGRKTHCKHGHEFTPENTKAVP